ncbi:13605_t:CDS:2 [Ambispora leptoticha]|uniref:13605_t:CDS:1 n=1 Tax=Ambispora leptoticha TaxID=144679 RepID=A0A9N9F745_9GLOM|nr:13605_t:CDS:2 [Ambispora leptoticha]
MPCPFCEVDNVENSDLKDRIVFQDDTIIVLHDLKPASRMHLLVISRQHILQHMIKTGRRILKQANYSQENTRLGFHVPPFLKINHLHLHCLGLPFRNKLVGIKYVEGLWYKSANKILKKLSEERRRAKNSSSNKCKKSKRSHAKSRKQRYEDNESGVQTSVSGSCVESNGVNTSDAGVSDAGVNDEEEEQIQQMQLKELNNHKDGMNNQKLTKISIISQAPIIVNV